MKQSSFIKINPADSVVVCLRPFKQGETIEVDGKTITLLQDTQLLLSTAVRHADHHHHDPLCDAVPYRRLSRQT